MKPVGVGAAEAVTVAVWDKVVKASVGMRVEASMDFVDVASTSTSEVSMARKVVA